MSNPGKKISKIFYGLGTYREIKKQISNGRVTTKRKDIVRNVH